MNKKFFLVFFFFSVSFSYLSAQDFTIEKTDSSGLYKLSDVVVTATKINTSTLELASSISVIDSQEIAAKNKITVLDLLRDEPGVDITQQGGPGMLASAYIRGGNNDQTLVLIDGVEANLPNDPSNTFDFSTLNTDDIQRIEILRGPQSTLYGSDALSGVINIITKKGIGKPKFFLSTEGGSYNTYRANGGFNGSTGIINYNFNASKFKTDGFSSASSKYGNTEKDGTTNYNADANLGLNFSEDFNLNFFYRYNKANTDYDQWGGQFGDDPTYIYKLDESIFRTEANVNFFGGMLNQKYGVSYFKNVRKYSYDSTLYNPSSSKSFYDGNKLKFDLQNNIALSNNFKFILGLETENEKANSEYFIYSSTFPFASVLPSNSARTSSVYLENQLNIYNIFFSSIGLRYDHHQKFGSQLTYRIAPAYFFEQSGTKIKATIGTGFKAPSIYYLYDPVYGNINLKPVTSIGWDAGIEQYFWDQQISFGLTYFNNSFENLFGVDQNYKTININKAKTNGLEFYSVINYISNLRIKINYTYTNTKDESLNSLDSGMPLLRRPKNKLTLNLNYNILKNLNSDLEILYIGERDDKDFSKYPAERIKLKSYTLVNVAVTYKFLNMLQLYGRIENLLDTQYEEIFGFGTAGLSGYLGFKLNL